MKILKNLVYLLLCASVCAIIPQETSQRPNIVFILADDLGWSDVSFHGSKQIPTPNVDALARDGIILNQYYAQALCSPSRGSLMTGKYPISIGFQSSLILSDEPWGLPLKERIIPEYLKSLDYVTHAVGKWHLGFFKDEYLPLNRGFDTFFGYYTALTDYYSHFSIEGNMTGFDLHDMDENVWQYSGMYGTDLYTTKAVNIIKEHDQKKPLFLYLAQQSVHSGNFATYKVQAPDKYVKPLVGIEDENRRIFAGMVSGMDNSVGEVFAALDSKEMLNNTIFIFSTDNGGAVNMENDFYGSKGSNYPLRGSKSTLWEGGVRGTAFVWSSHLRQRSRIYNNLMHISDWLPTLLSAAGGPRALEMLDKIDGVDHWPSLVNSMPAPRFEILHNIDDVEEVEAIRKGNYKLVKGNCKEGRRDGWFDIEGRPFVGDPPVQSPALKTLYESNYLKYLNCSKAAQILLRMYDRPRLLAMSCQTTECKQQLEVKCGWQRPTIDTCNSKNSSCLFDISLDPCELYNIAQELPEVAADLESAIDRYRPFIVPPGNKPADLSADPKFHGYVWVPWR